MTTMTLLDLDLIEMDDGAARGITQTLEPIDAASQMRRTVNGALVDISASQFRKYKSTIACRDQVPPVLDGIWPGQVLTVSCLSELAYRSSGGSPERDQASGADREDGAFTYYRPLLTMRVVRFNVETDEWGAAVGWSLELEEV
jgi:hypothetical protein